jgi:poly(ADP-ribose) glycohydrolase
VAIDALPFQNSKEQFNKINIDREIKKCFAGFSSLISNSYFDTTNLQIATGHWGCGAFKGNKQIKCR